VKGPLELAEGDGQAGEGHVALGARIAQALGFCAARCAVSVGSRSGLSNSKPAVSSSLRVRPEASAPGKADLEDSGGLAVEVCAFTGGGKDEASLRGGGLNRTGERGFCGDGHFGESCDRDRYSSILWERCAGRRIYNEKRAECAVIADYSCRESDQGLCGGTAAGDCGAGCFAGCAAGRVCGDCGSLGVGQVDSLLPAGRADAGYQRARGD
jgi:hypothetical protein